MPDFTITLEFDYRLQDSVSVGDVAYYVFTDESGGFQINSANLVEIGEITSIISRMPGKIICSTNLYGDQLEIGCNAGDNKEACEKAQNKYDEVLAEHLALMPVHRANPTEATASELIRLGEEIAYWYNFLAENGCNRLGDGGCGDPFILFSKNNCQEFASMIGYYGLFTFKNDSVDKAELFNVTVDAFESSK